MINKDHFKKLENMYLNAACNEYYNPKITITRGSAEITIPIRGEFFHAAGATHGAVYFKAMDDAAFFAANSLVSDFCLLTANFNVNFIRPITSGQLKAIGRIIYHSKKYFFAESIVYDSKEREIARGNGNFVKSNTRLTSQIGYS